jgi:hypothetical protein
MSLSQFKHNWKPPVSQDKDECEALIVLVVLILIVILFPEIF